MIGSTLLSAWLLAAQTAAPGAIEIRARAITPGEVLLITVESSTPVHVHVFNRDWPAYPDDRNRWRALVGIDLDTRPGRYDLEVRVGEGVLHRALIVQPRVFPTRRLRVDPDLVHPPPEMEARVEREAQRLRDLWEHSTARRLWTAPFLRPVREAANSAFGTRSVYNGEARPPHAGADFLSPSGRPVAAPNAGRVVLAEPLYFSGNTVVIDHGLGLFSLLAHLSRIDVKAGDQVTRGQLVGAVGATGRVTGPHLHWAVRVNNTRVDPLSLLYAAGSAPGAQHERQQR